MELVPTRKPRPVNTETAGPAGSGGDQDLIRRAPSGYLWNQALSFWLFFATFIFQLVITRLLPLDAKGTYELILTPANFAVYLAALGLESAGSVYLPRMLAEGGPGRAMAVATRLFVMRIAAMAVVALGVLWGLPVLATVLDSLHMSWASGFTHGIVPVMVAHRWALAAYVLGISAANLLSALLTALMRTRIVFIAGGSAQLLTVVLAYLFVLPLHGGPDGALLALTLPPAAAAVIYAVALFRILGGTLAWRARGLAGSMLRLGSAAWLADLANGSLIKLLAVAQLGAVVSLGQVAYFGLAFEMGHAAAFLFIAGLGGVGLAVMAAAYANHNLEYLAIAWRSVSKLQVLLAVPLVLFCVPHADAIMQVLYGQRYAAAGPLLALFLTLNAAVRVCGGGASEAALYVLGRQRWVVVARWGSLALLGGADVLLIPRYGAGGALLAVGIAQVGAEVFELVLARAAVARAYPTGFVAKVALALVPALAITVAWRPVTFAGLVIAGAIYAAVFLLALRAVRPLDAEDGALLAHVARPLQRALSPFVSPGRRSQSMPDSVVVPVGVRAAAHGTLPVTGEHAANH